jgi:hypothetical protein
VFEEHLRLRDTSNEPALDLRQSASGWPAARKFDTIEEILKDCTQEKAKIAGGNAARIYHVKVSTLDD